MHQPDTVPQRNIALVASEAIVEELRNVHLLHEIAFRRFPVHRLRPLSRFAGLRVLTLCRVFGASDGPAIGTTLRQLATSLEVRRDLGHVGLRRASWTHSPVPAPCRCSTRLNALFSADCHCCVTFGM